MQRGTLPEGSGVMTMKGISKVLIMGYCSGGGTAYGGSPWPKPPRPQSRAAGSLAHPFLRRWKAMFASGKRSSTPATLPLGRKHLKDIVNP